MKKLLPLIALCTMPFASFAQADSTATAKPAAAPASAPEASTTDASATVNPYKTKAWKVSANMRLTGYADDKMGDDKGATDAGFKANNIRINIAGDITNQLSFRTRIRETKSTDNQSQDKINNNIDYALVTYRLRENDDTYSINMGKRSIAYGGYEWDYNAIDISRYSDWADRSAGGMTGIGFTYKKNPNQVFDFEITNENTKTAPYGSKIAGTGEAIRYNTMPLAYSFKYSGKINETFSTISSINIFNEAVDQTTKQATLGLKAKVSEKWTAMVDYTYITGGLDRVGTMSEKLATIGMGTDTKATNTTYNTIWTRWEYQHNEKIKVILTGFVGNGTWYDADISGMNMDINNNGSYGEKADAYSYNTACIMPSVEYMLIPSKNFRVFAGYEYQMYGSSDAMVAAGADNFSAESRINFGIISPLDLFTFGNK